MPTSLSTLLAENPAIAAEYEKAIEAAKAEGFEAGLQKAQARIEAAAPFLKSDSVYGEAGHNLAIQVLAGKADPIALHTVASVLDAQRETQKQTAAQGETKEQGETPADPPEAEGDASIAAIDKEAAEYRKSRGLEV